MSFLPLEEEIHINCDVCGCSQVRPGAILFTPPNRNKNHKKINICVHCYKHIAKFIKEFGIEYWK